MKKQVCKGTTASGEFHSLETHRRIMPGIYYGTHKSVFDKGWRVLVRLPFHYGLNIASGFRFSVRSWEWAKYDYADVFTYLDFHRWMRLPSAKH